MSPSPVHARKPAAREKRRVKSPPYHQSSRSSSTSAEKRSSSQKRSSMKHAHARAKAARSVSPQHANAMRNGKKAGSGRKIQRPRDRRQYSAFQASNGRGGQSSRDLRFERPQNPKKKKGGGNGSMSDLRSASVDVRRYNIQPERRGGGRSSMVRPRMWLGLGGWVH